MQELDDKERRTFLLAGSHEIHSSTLDGDQVKVGRCDHGRNVIRIGALGIQVIVTDGPGDAALPVLLQEHVTTGDGCEWWISQCVGWLHTHWS